MPPIEFARPALLALLLLLPLWIWWRRRPARANAAPVADGAMLTPAGRTRWRLAVPTWCRGGAFAAFTLAAAGPIVGGADLEYEREGVAIVLALDVSSSMLAEDFAPDNRLEVAKRQATAFVRGRRSDRIGLVAFAGEALTQVPITTDYAIIEQAIGNLRIGTLEDGTAIGSGLLTAVNRLRRAPDKSKVIVLLTDGENNKGLVDPRTAAETARAYGIRVYTIGVGTEGEAPIPTGRGLGGFRYEILPVRIDEKLLTEIAEQSGARYFRATDAEALGRIFREVDRLERTPLAVRRRVQRDETTRPLLIAGLVLLLLELATSATIARRVP
jgi:Ca-activated chloride channel family protein